MSNSRIDTRQSPRLTLSISQREERSEYYAAIEDQNMTIYIEVRYVYWNSDNCLKRNRKWYMRLTCRLRLQLLWGERVRWATVVVDELKTAKPPIRSVKSKATWKEIRQKTTASSTATRLNRDVYGTLIEMCTKHIISTSFLRLMEQCMPFKAVSTEWYRRYASCTVLDEVWTS